MIIKPLASNHIELRNEVSDVRLFLLDSGESISITARGKDGSLIPLQAIAKGSVAEGKRVMSSILELSLAES